MNEAVVFSFLNGSPTGGMYQLRFGIGVYSKGQRLSITTGVQYAFRHGRKSPGVYSGYLLHQDALDNEAGGRPARTGG